MTPVKARSVVGLAALFVILVSLAWLISHGQGSH